MNSIGATFRIVGKKITINHYDKMKALVLTIVKHFDNQFNDDHFQLAWVPTNFGYCWEVKIIEKKYFKYIYVTKSIMGSSDTIQFGIEGTAWNLADAHNDEYKLANIRLANKIIRIRCEYQLLQQLKQSYSEVHPKTT